MLGPLPLLILQSCLIIVAARAVGVLARRLGQPAVIAEVIAGVVLGPSLLGRVSPSLFLALFPKSSLSGLSLLSQVGLVFFMFLIGLELDPKLLRGRGASSFAISAAGIFVPFTLGALLALQIFAGQAGPGVPKASFTLFMGIAMSITAFPVLARILAERKLIRTNLGSIALACAAADDVTAWCLLAFVVSFVHAKAPLAALITTAEALSFAGFMLLVVRPLLARLAARITTRENLTQNVVALTFVLLLASALVSELIGIHALFGAFLFGAIMPRQGDYAQALAERLEDFVVVALLPLFFAYSGLRTELGLVVGLQDWLLCLLLIAVACLGKFGGSFSVARLTGMSTRDSAALGVLMNTRGLMELIVLNIGLDLGVISPKIFTMMVLMALVTTVMTTPLLELIAPRALTGSEGGQDGALANRVARLLLCVGDARIGPAMARLAVSCTEGPGPSESVALHLERPRDRTSNYLGAGVLGAEVSRRTGLASFLETASVAGVTVETASFDSSDPAADICEVARAKRADYVVLGLHRPVLGQNVFGGTVGAVLARSPAPVALLIDHGLSRAFAPESSQRRVLVALSGGGQDARVLDFAEQLLRDKSVSLSLLLVTPSDGAVSDVARAELLAAAQPTRVSMRSEPSATRHAVLLTAASQADLVLIGLDPSWGLSADGLDAAAARLVIACPASLLVIRERSAQS
ncbi:MAG TPA: cation:proton antiporter [Polyangiaceae bacterium]|jgi:Kef-type K+ transport system membrane component KefB|nr:cation:proton antiporter [Polyangiaceae bacterium]